MFTRTSGITPPGYPDYPIYKTQARPYSGSYFVYDSGLFWRVVDWCEYYKAHKRTVRDILTSDNNDV